jgi:hypothetical protein
VVRYLVKMRGLRPEQIAVFAQQDAYGALRQLSATLLHGCIGGAPSVERAEIEKARKRTTPMSPLYCWPSACSSSALASSGARHNGLKRVSRTR